MHTTLPRHAHDIHSGAAIIDPYPTIPIIARSEISVLLWHL